MVSGIKPEFLKQIDFFSDFEMEALRLILLTCEQKSFSASHLELKFTSLYDFASFV